MGFGRLTGVDFSEGLNGAHMTLFSISDALIKTSAAEIALARLRDVSIAQRCLEIFLKLTKMSERRRLIDVVLKPLRPL